ncbi:MAG: DUF2911 domain-containing protein [Balneolales bacterium]|nr:DUF2911 domain-containing protein [Balneolales bacterium]
MKKLLFALALGLLYKPALAQLPVSLTLPAVSPFEERSITIGFTNIHFEYSSVGIRDREIWGGLVPYGEVWRTGANKNTIFTVTDDVLVNGNELEAGSYGFHTIPGEEEWIIIFSHFSEAWGSYFYDESEDALRITVPVEEMESKYEWMKFSFSNYTATSVDIALKWAHRSVPFTVEIPMEVTFAHIKNQFKTLPAFGWQGWYQGANYTLANNYELEQGLEWAEQAVRRERNVQTLGVLGKLQAKNEQPEQALETANELAKWEENWRAHFSAGEIFELAGKNNDAKTAFESAMKLTTSERTKASIKSRLDQLN